MICNVSKMSVFRQFSVSKMSVSRHYTDSAKRDNMIVVKDVNQRLPRGFLPP